MRGAAHPGLVSRPAEPEKDRIALLKLARWAGRYGPNRHIDGADAFGSISPGVAHLFGGEESLLDDITRRLASFGVATQVGLADTLGAAHALARFGCPPEAAWAMAPASETREAIGFLPVEALRLDAPRILLLKRFGPSEHRSALRYSRAIAWRDGFALPMSLLLSSCGSIRRLASWRNRGG